MLLCTLNLGLFSLGFANYPVAYGQWCDSGATGAIAPVPHFKGGAPLQFLFHLFIVHLAYILQKLTFDLNYYSQTILSHMQYS